MNTLQKYHVMLGIIRMKKMILVILMMTVIWNQAQVRWSLLEFNNIDFLELFEEKKII